MRIRLIAGGLIAAATLATPLAASAASVADLEAQIASLVSQFTQLEAQLATLQLGASTSTLHATVTPIDSPAASSTATVPSGTPSVAGTAPMCPLIGRALAMGARGDDVASLQRFLASSGLLSADSATGYFGALTLAALKEWQSNNGVVSNGDASTTGWGVVGPKTQAAIARICGGAPLPNNDTLEVSTTGLTAQAKATVNVRSSCSAITYTLDWGDGSPLESIAIPAESCAPLSQTFSHTYAVAGSPVVLLNSSTSHIRAPIALTAVNSCADPYIIVSALPSGIVGTEWSVPVLSGAASTSLSALGLPAGITIVRSDQLDSSTAATSSIWSLQGTPLAAGSFSIAISAQNSCGTTQKAFSLSIASSTAAALSAAQCPVIVPPSCSADRKSVV